MADDNFLAIEDELMARLTERLASQRPAVHVLSAADLDGVIEEKQLTPAVHVVYQGYSVAEAGSAGKVARIEQTWLVVVATRNTRSLKAGDAARAQSGELARLVMGSLMGWRPASASKPLRLVSGPSAGFSAGHHYLPLAFVAEIVAKAAVN
ncbi:MAG: DUF1834 family protein [Xanthomonadaceae bacterium]|nr:DUF1834 family protein [Xanthomonadaceae bacterium]